MKKIADYPFVPERIGSWIPLEEWMSLFDKSWDSLRSYYFQFERLQEYKEKNNPSWEEFNRGNFEEAEKKIEGAIKADIPYYQDLCQKNIQYVRVHAAEIPLSDYLLWELSVYRILSWYGQRIMICDISGLDEGDELRRSYDFLLFDEDKVMIQDYGEDGILSGGWMVEDANKIGAFVKLAENLVSASVPLGAFERKHGIK